MFFNFKHQSVQYTISICQTSTIVEQIKLNHIKSCVFTEIQFVFIAFKSTTDTVMFC